MSGKILIFAALCLLAIFIYPQFMHNDSETIIKQTKDNPEFAVIWLHGLGADGNDFVPILKSMNFDAVPGIKFILPHAPMRPITINGGMTMRGWYDIAEMDLGQQQDTQGIKQSADIIKSLIEEQIKLGFAPEQIFLAGFSQGGAIALYCGLSLDYSLAGVVALSTYVPITDQLEIKRKPEVFYAHGEHDPIIPIALAQKSREWLINNGITPTWHQYPMQHQVVMEEIDLVNQWLIARIKSLLAN